MVGITLIGLKALLFFAGLILGSGMHMAHISTYKNAPYQRRILYKS